jgi:hypothetical protein
MAFKVLCPALIQPYFVLQVLAILLILLILALKLIYLIILVIRFMLKFLVYSIKSFNFILEISVALLASLILQFYLKESL